MKTLKEKIEIEIKAADGDLLQWKSEIYPEWQSIGHSVSPSFIFYWLEKDYRIKPEPREFWVNVYDDNHYELSTDENAHKMREVIKTIKVREVLG